MKPIRLFAAIILICSINLIAGSEQLAISQNDDHKSIVKKSNFNVGLLVGTYFPNKHTVELYDGYGYDAEGNKNDFLNSFMFRKIILENGGFFMGQTDQVALALGVSHGEWSFEETDMPFKMKYNPALMVGIHLYYSVTKKDLLLLNINITKLTIGGNFSIILTNPTIGIVQPGYKNIKIFSITGAEQRLILQIGYRRILGTNDIFNFFIEGGPSLNLTEYQRNTISINNLHMDIATYYTQEYYSTYRAKYLRGIGLGVFTGFGLNINANENWNMQLLCSPAFEKINIGTKSKFIIQNTIGVKAAYTL
jgi:hypothetical protein